MGSGYYVALTQSSPKGYFIGQTQPKEVKLTEERVAEEIVRDIEVGVDDTGIRAGMIGEIGCSWPLENSEKVSLRGAARAQKQTGAGLNIHPGRSPDAPFEIIEILDKAGADISRVAMSHIERTIAEHDTRVKLAKTGCYIEYDFFAFEGWYPCRFVVSEANPIRADLPSDHERINQIMALVDEGFLNQILISHDHLYKIRMCRYGGPGYAHIVKNVVPLMRAKGMPEEHIHTILVENPKRLLCFV
jgi:phosphotriesterase-related protein